VDGEVIVAEGAAMCLCAADERPGQITRYTRVGLDVAVPVADIAAGPGIFAEQEDFACSDDCGDVSSELLTGTVRSGKRGACGAERARSGVPGYVGVVVQLADVDVGADEPGH
jgi:hypothetical protein